MISEWVGLNGWSDFFLQGEESERVPVGHCFSYIWQQAEDAKKAK